MDTDSESYHWECLFPSMENSSGPSANVASNPVSFPPQGMPVIDRGCSHPWSLGICDPQVDAGAGILVDCGAHSDVQFSGLRSALYSPEIPVAASDIYYKDLPPTCPSQVVNMYQAMISPSISLNSTLLGSQSSFTSVNSSEDPRDNISAKAGIFVKADPNRNRGQGGMPMNTPLDHSLQCTEIHTTASSRSPLKPAKGLPSEEPKRCDICGRGYKQTQGVARHIREAHKVSFCPHCGGFKWHRSSQYKKHLEEQHPDVHLHAALTGVKNYRRRATLKKNRQKGQQASTPAIELDQSSQDEHLSQPLTPPLHPVLEVGDVSSPAESCVAYYPQPEPTVPTNANVARGREYTPHEVARELASLDPNYAHFAFSSTEGRALLPATVDIPFCL